MITQQTQKNAPIIQSLSRNFPILKNHEMFRSEQNLVKSIQPNQNSQSGASLRNLERESILLPQTPQMKKVTIVQDEADETSSQPAPKSNLFGNSRQKTIGIQPYKMKKVPLLQGNRIKITQTTISDLINSRNA